VIGSRWTIGALALALTMAMEPAPGWQAANQPLPESFEGIPNLRFKHYDVVGTDWASINASLEAQGPRHGDGTTAHGRTDIHIGSSWTQQRRGKVCSVTGIKVRFSAVVILSRLADQSAVPEELAAQWRGFLTILERHEAGHARISLDHLDMVRAAVAAAPCGKEQERAKAALMRIEEMQRDYDRRTRHGLAQGDILR
jgi:predicted secreted Zn-dependent protease